MKHTLLASILMLGSALSLSSIASAQGSYQFALDITHSKVDVRKQYTDDPHGEINGIGAALYLEPVQLSGKYHQKVAAFYQRASGVSLGASEGEYQDLSIIRSGRILEHVEFGQKQVSLFGSIPDTPFWLAGNFIEFDETQLKFNVGPDAKGTPDNYKSLTAGYFLHPDHTVFARYSNAYMDGFGGGFRSYFRLEQGMALEFGGYIERVKSDEQPSLVVVENTIRNADIGGRDHLRQWQTHLSFFPHADISISVNYGKSEGSEEVKEEAMGSELKYFVTPNVHMGIGHQENHLNKLGLHLGNLQYEQYFITLGFRF